MLNSRGSFFSNIPTVTKNLLIINILVWIAQISLPKVGIDLTNLLALHYWRASDFNIAQMFSYMFMHSDNDFSHLFFNMFSLLMLGPLLERALGSMRYLFYYITCGLGAAIVQELVWEFTWMDIFAPGFANYNGLSMDEAYSIFQAAVATGENIPFLNQLITVGASGCVFGILLAFGVLFPNLPMYIMFIPIPIKAKYMVIFWGAIELLFGVTGAMDSIAHFAHLGGMIFGLILLLYWKKKGTFGGSSF